MYPRELKQLLSILSTESDDSVTSPFVQGKAYLIRTVTHYWVGRCVEVGDKWIILEDSSWVADTGEFVDAVKEGSLLNSARVGNSIVFTGAMVDAIVWVHNLP